MFNVLSDHTAAPSRSNHKRTGLQLSSRVSALLLTSLFFVVVFDPSDSLTGLKKYLFLLLLSWWLLLRTRINKQPRILPASLLIFIFFGLVFPTLSIFSYYLQGGDFEEYEGFSTLVGYLSLMLLVIFSSMREPTVHFFVKVLTVQALVTIGLFALLSLNSALIETITTFGYDHGFLWINAKSYGGFHFLQIFFKTSPFMVLSLAYFSEKCFSLRSSNPITFVLLITSCLALLISGTRANIAFAVIIPGYFAIQNFRWGSFSLKICTLFALCFLLALLLVNVDILIAMLDPSEESNSVKLGYWGDYLKIFSDPVVLIFGQGIGVVHYFESLGMDLRITEVTLLELVRNFGIFMAIGYLAFWIAPLIMLSKNRFADYNWLRIAYASYLLISMSNYFILSSTGMVLLSIVYGVCLGRVDNYTVRKKESSVSIQSIFSRNSGNAPSTVG